MAERMPRSISKEFTYRPKALSLEMAEFIPDTIRDEFDPKAADDLVNNIKVELEANARLDVLREGDTVSYTFLEKKTDGKWIWDVEIEIEPSPEDYEEDLDNLE